MNNYKLTDEGLVTSDPVIAAMFLNEAVELFYKGAWWKWTIEEDGAAYLHETIRIPYPLVWEAIQPVEGEGYFVLKHDIYFQKEANEESPFYVISFPEKGIKTENVVRACPLTTSKTIGELRALVSKCKGEKDVRVDIS
jgi:hypothetical protein